MTDKHLTELGWRTFVKDKGLKDKGLKDTALAKALAALEKAKTASEQVEVLEDIGKQAADLRKSAKGDKTVADYLDELDKAQAKQLAAARAEVKTQAARTTEDEAGDDVILTTALAALLKQVRNGVEMQAMVLTDGKHCGVMLAKRPIPSSKSKLIKDYLGLVASKPPMVGTCLLEENAVTFVLEQRDAGLVKRLRQALFDQTDLRMKVRVRGADPADVEEDDESPESDREASAPGAASAPAQHETSQPHVGAPTATMLTEGMTKLGPLIQHVLVARPELRADLRQSVASFQADIKAGKLAEARATLMETAALVRGLEARVGETAAAHAGGEGAFSRVNFEKIHLDWEASKTTVRERLAVLNRAILASRDDPMFSAAAARLDQVLAHFNEGLGDVLDRLRNAASSDDRVRLAARARDLAGNYLTYLAGNALVAHVDANPFGVAVDARATLSKPLEGLQRQLSALGA